MNFHSANTIQNYLCNYYEHRNFKCTQILHKNWKTTIIIHLIKAAICSNFAMHNTSELKHYVIKIVNCKKRAAVKTII